MDAFALEWSTAVTTNDLIDIAQQLTQPWEEVLSPQETKRDGYTTIYHDALLDMLHDAKVSSTGMTEAGRSDASSRNLLNLAAYQLWEGIDGSARAWIRELSRQRAERDLKDAVMQLARIANALWRTGQMDEPQYARLVAMVGKWRADIEAIFDPPVVKEIKAACPRCANTHYIDGEGSRSAAIILTYSRQFEPRGECRRCMKVWEGERELLELGFSIGANMNPDELRDMGVAGWRAA
jgi:hypothetical protein